MSELKRSNVQLSLQPVFANLSRKFASIKFSSLSVSFLPNEPCGSEASLSSPVVTTLFRNPPKILVSASCPAEETPEITTTF